MRNTKLWALILALAHQLAGAAACVALYGARHEVPHYGYGYIGLDWPEEYATCTGTRQSPLDVPAHAAFQKVAEGHQSYFEYGQLASNGSNIKVVNNGHTVQVVFPATGYTPNASVVMQGDASTAKLVTKFNTTGGTTQRVKLSPTQFHFHTRSEHVVDGKQYAMEMHIVNWVYAPDVPACGTGGCATVVGIMFELAQEGDETANTFLDTIWSVMPSDEGVTAYIPDGKVLDFNVIMPGDRSYITFEGSLTTPPCTEGILWHLLTTPMKITAEQLHHFELAVGATDCTTHIPVTRKLTSSTGTIGSTSGTSTAAATSGFEAPAYTADPVDGLMCKKVTGQNYREVQNRQSRPIQFYAAPRLCDTQINLLQSRSKVLKKMLGEANSTDAITLNQYKEIVEAGLTQDQGCAGMTNKARGLKAAATGVLQAVMAAVLLAWLLVEG